MNPFALLAEAVTLRGHVVQAHQAVLDNKGWPISLWAFNRDDLDEQSLVLPFCHVLFSRDFEEIDGIIVQVNALARRLSDPLIALSVLAGGAP